MVPLPLANALLDRGWDSLPIIAMTAAWAVLVSASSFAAAATKPGGHPRAHQLWPVPVAVIAMVPGVAITLLLDGWLASTAQHATRRRADAVAPAGCAPPDSDWRRGGGPSRRSRRRASLWYRATISPRDRPRFRGALHPAV